MLELDRVHKLDHQFTQTKFIFSIFLNVLLKFCANAVFSIVGVYCKLADHARRVFGVKSDSAYQGRNNSRFYTCVI